MRLPDYFLALNKQYGLATNDQQADLHVRSVVEAWFFTLSADQQNRLNSVLPNYLKFKKKLFYTRTQNKINGNRHSIIHQRLMVGLQKTDVIEVEQIMKGFLKSLKVVLDNNQKFEISKLMDAQMREMFAQA